MRPQSIVMFERLFLASLVLGVVGVLLSYGQMAEFASGDPGMRRLGLGSGFLVGVLGVSYAVYLLLWYLIARRASTVAKWILVVFTVLGVLSALPALGGPWNATLVLSLAVYALEIVALVYLFRPDARAWFAGETQGPPVTFD